MSTEQSFSSTIPLGDGQEGEEDSPYTMSGSDFGAVPETVLEEEVTIEVVGDKRKTRSEVWGHFEHKIIDGKQRAICVHCGKSLLGDPKQGTTHLRNHLNRCKEYQKKCGEQKHFKTEQKKSEDGSYVLNPEKARQALARMIVAHEYPLAVVDHHFFKEFCSVLQPLFKNVSRNTIKKDIIKQFNEEKRKTMKLMQENQSRIAITSDMWTSTNQNQGYMAVTAHFIDDSWVLQSRLVR